jgi:hypothetical protein
LRQQWWCRILAQLADARIVGNDYDWSINAVSGR